MCGFLNHIQYWIFKRSLSISDYMVCSFQMHASTNSIFCKWYTSTWNWLFINTNVSSQWILLCFWYVWYSLNNLMHCDFKLSIPKPKMIEKIKYSKSLNSRNRHKKMKPVTITIIVFEELLHGVIFMQKVNVQQFPFTIHSTMGLQRTYNHE